MVISITNNTLLKDFLIKHEIETALIVKGPLSKAQMQDLHQKLGLVSLANGDFIIFVDPPLANYSDIRGWYWANNKLMDVTNGG